MMPPSIRDYVLVDRPGEIEPVRMLTHGGSAIAIIEIALKHVPLQVSDEVNAFQTAGRVRANFIWAICCETQTST
jgi:hypothetical protein